MVVSLSFILMFIFFTGDVGSKFISNESLLKTSKLCCYAISSNNYTTIYPLVTVGDAMEVEESSNLAEAVSGMSVDSGAVSGLSVDSEAVSGMPADSEAVSSMLVDSESVSGKIVDSKAVTLSVGMFVTTSTSEENTSQSEEQMEKHVCLLTLCQVD